MAKFLITYDLKKPGKDYSTLIEAIKEYPYCHPMGSVWFVESSKTAGQIRDHLKEFIDSNDVLFVCEITDWGSMNMKTCADWLNDK